MRHHLDAGFPQVLLLAADGIAVAADLAAKIHRIRFDAMAESAMITAVNRLIEAAPGIWPYYCTNGEYRFHPFCATRNIRAMLTFQTEERRDAVLGYVIDLYASDLNLFPNVVALDQAGLDRSGYYALSRPDPANPNQPRAPAGFLWRIALAVRRTQPRPPPQDRPDRPVHGQAGPELASGFHLFGRGIQHLRLALAPQRHHRRGQLSHRQGTADQCRIKVRYPVVPLPQFQPLCLG